MLIIIVLLAYRILIHHFLIAEVIVVQIVKGENPPKKDPVGKGSPKRLFGKMPTDKEEFYFKHLTQ